MQMKLGQSQTDAALRCDAALDLPTFSATAEVAGISLVTGGYHIQADNIADLELGRKVSVYIYPKSKSRFDGTATKNN